MALIKSTYNIIKKDDINVELRLAQCIAEIKTNPFVDEFYTNIYKNLLVREFQAHEDSITDISEIEEPASFVTCSKDKKFKIWNFNCECLGEVLVLPSIHNNKPIETEWKFVVDWEKLNLKELKEVMKIYDSLTNSEIMFMDEDVLMKEAIRGGEDVKKNVAKAEVYKRRRYNPILEKKADDNRKNEGADDEDVRLEVK
jgi:hypothetical protein